MDLCYQTTEKGIHLQYVYLFIYFIKYLRIIKSNLFLQRTVESLIYRSILWL